MNRVIFFGIAALLLLPARNASGFLDWQEAGQGGSVRGFFAAGLGLTHNPELAGHALDRDKVLWNGDFRLLADYFHRDAFRLEANVRQSVAATPQTVFTALSLPAAGRQGVERSDILAWQQHTSSHSQARLAVDSLNIRWQDADHEWIIGRQPVSLAATVYFTPNDFFAPFAAQTFFRVYKPGVDAVRFEKRLADLSQLTLVGVLGYERKPAAATGWSNGPDWSRSSVLARWTGNRQAYEWGLLAGSVREHSVVGGSLQGEYAGWLGVRAEGHYAQARKEGETSGLEAVLGLEHRFPSSLIVRIEQFHHGQGFSSIDAAISALAAASPPAGYLGKDYSALGFSYEFSPLLTGNLLLLRNWTDSSWLATCYAVYSLSDESELAVNIALPGGHGPSAATIRSEFGSFPLTSTLAYRLYF